MRSNPPRQALAWITLILLAAVGLRVIGVAWGTPDRRYSRSETSLGRTNAQVIVHPDAFHFAARSYLMVARRDLNPHFFENPSFYIDLNVLLHVISNDTSQYPPPDSKIDMRQAAPFSVYPMARLMTALMGLLGVAFIYAAGRRLGDTRIGLMAALVLAVSFADVQHAHYETTNVAAGALVCGSLWTSLRLLKPNPRWQHYVLCGLLVGLAGSTKYNAGLIGIMYGLCGLYAVWRNHSAWRVYLLGFVAVALGFFIATPYAAFDTNTFLRDFEYITSQYIAGQGYPETDQALPFHLLYLAWFGLGLVGALLVVPGTWAGLRDRRRRVGVAFILIFLVVYALIVLRGRRLGDHLLVTVVGTCALLTALGAVWLYERLGSRRSVGIVMVSAIVAIPLAYSLYFDRMLTQPDTRQLAQAWIYAHISSGTHVHLTGPYNVPLDSADYSTSQTFGGDLRPLSSVKAAQGAKVLVVSDAIRFLYNSANYWLPADYAAQQNAFEDQLTAGLVKVAQFERPRWPGDDTMITTASYFHNPTITIYCVTSACDTPIIP